MKTKKTLIIILSALLIAISLILIFIPDIFAAKESSEDDDVEETCTIIGKVIERPETENIVLMNPFDDIRIDGYPKIEVGKDGSFSYKMTEGMNQLYHLAFEDMVMRGSYCFMPFIAEGDTLYVELYPEDDYDKWNIKGGVINDRYSHLNSTSEKAQEVNRFADSCYSITDEMEKQGRYFNDEYMKLAKLRDEAWDSENMTLVDSLYRVISQMNVHTQEVSEILSVVDNKYDEYYNWKLDRVSDTIDLAGLSVLAEIIFMNRNETLKKRAGQIYTERYSESFAVNPMSEKIRTYLPSLEVKVGSKYIDFEALGADGDYVKLSDLIKGKVAVIDLWASWCGPCIRKSISFIPVWKQFSKYNFSIVGVARENEQSLPSMKKILDDHKFPWTNLIELNDKGNIWANYNIPFAGGRVLLVDEEGKILAIDFDAEYLREYLEKKFL